MEYEISVFRPDNEAEAGQRRALLLITISVFLFLSVDGYFAGRHLNVPQLIKTSTNQTSTCTWFDIHLEGRGVHLSCH